jgi:peptide methionine sulfoxide reductase MsrB
MGGVRYCINSEALRVVPRDKMAAEGYGDLLGLLQQ